MTSGRWAWITMLPCCLVLVLVLVACESSSGTSTTDSVSSTSTSISAVPGTSTGSSTSSTSVTTSTVTAVSPCRDAEMVQPVGTVLAFYAACDSGSVLYPVYRPGSLPPTLEQALSMLVVGTAPEERKFGLSTGFDFVEEVDLIEVVVDINRGGVAHVDFRVGGERWHPGGRASTSHQLFSFLDPLLATVFQNAEVGGLDRSTLCWGESDCTGVTSRAAWEGMLFVNTDTLTHGGCTLELARWYPDQCTLEGVLAVPTQTATVVNVAVGDTLSVRAGPGVEYFQAAELAPGADVEITGESATAADGGMWRLTELGWVNGAFLDGPTLCDPTLVAAIATDALAAARLMEPGAVWEPSPDGGVFGSRTTDPEQFARAMGFDCSWQATQRIADTERLAVAAWIDQRVSMVIQTNDSPTDPYRKDRTVDILVDAPEGELVAPETWAVTLSDGGSLILLTRNTSNLGWVAKSWLAEYVFVGDDNTEGSNADLTTTERMAKPALRAAGGRNVLIAEDSHGSLVTVISFVSPSGNTLFATVGPEDQFDPFGHIPHGTVFFQTIDNTPIRLVDLTERFPASAAAFFCDGFVWAIEARDSSPPETSEFVLELISHLQCG